MGPARCTSRTSLTGRGGLTLRAANAAGLCEHTVGPQEAQSKRGRRESRRIASPSMGGDALLNRENPIVVRLYETEMPYLLSTYYRDGVPQQEITLEDVLEVNRMLENWDEWDEWSEWHWYPMDSVPRLLAALNLKVARGLAAPDEVLRRCALQVVRFGAVHVEPHWADAAGIEEALALCESDAASADLACAYAVLAQLCAGQDALRLKARYLGLSEESARQARTESSPADVWRLAAVAARIADAALACEDKLRAADHLGQALELLDTSAEGLATHSLRHHRVRVLRRLATVEQESGAWDDAAKTLGEVSDLIRADHRAAGDEPNPLAHALVEQGEALEQAGHGGEATGVLGEAVQLFSDCVAPELEDRAALRRALATLEGIRHLGQQDGVAQPPVPERAKAVVDAQPCADAVELVWQRATLWWVRERKTKWDAGSAHCLVELLNADPVAITTMRDEASLRLGEGTTLPNDTLYEPGQGQSSEWYVARRDFCNAVLALQAVAAVVCSRDACEDNEPLSVPGVQHEWFSGLQAVLGRADPHGLIDLQVSWTPGRPDGADGSLHAGGLGGLLTVSQSSGRRSHLDPGPAVADALAMLLAVAREGKPRLKRCEMPERLMEHLDYQLGEISTHPGYCGRYYIAPRGAKTCGNAGCVEVNKVLKIRLEEGGEAAALRERAKWHAERAYKDSFGETYGFDELWEQCGRDLIQLRECVGWRQRKDRT